MCPISNDGVSIVFIVDKVLHHVGGLLTGFSIHFAKPTKFKINLTIGHQTLGDNGSSVINAWGHNRSNVVYSTNRLGRVGDRYL